MTGAPASNLQASQPSRCATPVSSGQQITLFCDFDGPIVDVSDRYYSTYQLGLADTLASYQAEGINLPIQILSKQQFWQMKQDRVADREIAMRSGLQGEQIDLFLGQVSQHVNHPLLLQKDKIQPGVSWALALLHSQGVKLVLVTLRTQKQARQILVDYGLARLFSGFYGTEEESAAYQNQPEAKAQLLAKAIAEQASDRNLDLAWMVGDTEADVIAAQVMGIKSIAVTCGIRSRYSLHKLQPTVMVTDLLSAAHHLLGITQLVCA